MKKLLIVPVLLLSSITFAQECKVIGVSDGDTLTCLVNRHTDSLENQSK